MYSVQLLRHFKYGVFVKPTSLIRSSSTAVNVHDVTNDVKPFSQIPGPKGLYNIPYIGTALHFKPFTNYEPNDILEILSNTKDKYGDIVKMRIGAKYVVFVYHPDLARTVFKLPFKENIRTGLDLMEVYYKRTGIPKDLGVLQGEEWAALRKPAQEKMLRPAVVASYVPLIEKVTNDFVQMLRKKETVEDTLKDMMNYTTESVGMLCFNTRLGCFGDNQNQEAANMANLARAFFKDFQTAITMPFKTFKFYRTKLYQSFENTNLEITRIARKQIVAQKERLKKLESEGKLAEYLEKEPNFLYSLLADPRMTEATVNGIVTSLFMAGIDSTANSIVFVLMNLALNPDKQAKLYNEIKNVVGDSESLTKEHLNDLSYLKACVKESQRIVFPVMIGAPRFLEADIVLGGYEIPKQTLVHPNMSAMSKDERFYPRPNEYIPERWLRDTDSEIAKGQDFPFGMKPFGFGPRGCIGQRFAEIEMYIGITKIIQNFEVSMPPDVTEVKSMVNTFSTPAHTVVMHLKDRKKAAN